MMKLLLSSLAIALGTPQIPAQDVVGKAFVIIWPISRAGGI